MKLSDKFKNLFLSKEKYKVDSEAVIIACYFNPQRNPYRLFAFKKFYESIKHLNYSIVECTIGDSKPELTSDLFPDLIINRVRTKDLLWHKETLLNQLVYDLPEEFKYVFWLDTDVIFTNKNWLVEATQKLRDGANLIQPFEYCVHLEKDQTEPSFNVDYERPLASTSNYRHPKLWKSFGYNHVIGKSGVDNYDVHGHVGFAWGAKRWILDLMPLYDRALIGGADHIIAHAGAGHIGHSCITKSFTEDIEAVNRWSKKFYKLVEGKISYVKGDLYHIWHGDIAKREYLKRVQEFTPTAKKITERDDNGFFINRDDNSYMTDYYKKREDTSDDGFINSLVIGMVTDSAAMGTAVGGNLLGAVIGDMLNDSDDHSQCNHDHSTDNSSTNFS